MVPIISFVGWSGIGKTTLLEKLIPELVRRGYRVATVKHVHHFSIDHEGKDTWRHRKAGAACTIISSAEQLAMIRDVDHDASLDEIREKYAGDVDIIITEGFKQERAPKIEVFRAGEHPSPVFADGRDLVALVTDTDFSLGVPSIGIAEIDRLADFIEDKFLKH
ncbi:MAG TPA: molybdopterin-guanine dinucleotide biosynthesis protein B [Spirochaetota bacterium]|nr:molybdopterin-guanine dinucleotide biosynthesis protein B [Spirochaetota bacterium]HPC41614.1 molybdopterin-guanine dinucleotide biosynthesis protein B [Spirochaetota bacterium]HQH97109.1 molybdopterin-guanine dinucleotide biosynthesis protein B [Spirochaetota bacterium]HQJ70019.1 molybdopterin-guanine dinucleotide biosynthesis protein B [Spirochaetota bacterium]